MRYTTNVGGLLRLREACPCVGTGGPKHSRLKTVHPLRKGLKSLEMELMSRFPEKKILCLLFLCTVRLLQLSASASDEQERVLAATAATIFSSLFCYWCIYTWLLLTIMRIILPNCKENRPFRIQFVLTKCLRKITLFWSVLNYSSFSLILIKFLRAGIIRKKNSFHWQKKATQINEENVYSV